MTRKIDPGVLSGFIEEAREYLPKILADIDSFAQDDTREEDLEEAHRLTHSIKGAASMVGLSALGHIAYYAEETLEQIGARQLTMDQRTAAVLKEAMELISTYLDQLTADEPVERPIVERAVVAFRRLRGLPAAEDQAEIDRLLPATSRQPATAFPAAEPPVRERAVDISPEVLEAFEEEAEEHLQQIQERLQRLETAPQDRPSLQEIRRSVHTLKGAAAMVGLTEIARLSHRMEDLLDLLYERERELTPEVLELLLASSDALNGLAEQDETAEERQGLHDLYRRYSEVLDNADDEAEPPVTAMTEPLLPLGEEGVIDLQQMAAPPTASNKTPAAKTSSQFVRVPIERLDDVVRLVSELIVQRSTFEQQFTTYVQEVKELRLSIDRLERLSGRLENDYEVLALAGGQARASATATDGALALALQHEGFDELELDRYTEFHLLSRELSETSSDLAAITTDLGTGIGDFESSLGRLHRLTSRVQDRLMHLRMVPFATLASRLQRTVRVTAGKRGKRVRLILDGEETEIDKTVLEKISDPLLHLLRNAVDHGIELPAVRLVRDKPEIGEIQLRAYDDGTHVVVQISDDGAGLAPEMLRRTAVEKGFLSVAEAEQRSGEDLYSIIFQPGFSTAKEVSEISGRGVGLDAVKSSVVDMKGTLTVDSVPGRGVTFTIRLPMNLAVTRVLLVRAGEHRFAIPLGTVLQILRQEREELEKLASDPIIRVHDRTYPVTHLSEKLGLQQTSSVAKRLPILILQLGASQAALVVDQILEAREVVVKPLGPLLRRVEGITGATLLGDGSAVLILNPTELLTSSARVEPDFHVPARHARQVLDVLIVDDSVSVRRVLSKLVQSAGWHPTTARDGLEALEIIQRLPRLPDAILLDIEMPRMDGYELTSTLKAQDAYRDVPIIILTSRAGDKHRQRAFELGANEYLVKPFQDETLLSVVRRLAREAWSAS